MVEKLHARNKHDHRLDTALSMLDRYGVIRIGHGSDGIQVVADLPPALTDGDRLAEKLRRDQQKLLALVNFVHHDGDRKAYLHEYFGLPYPELKVGS